MRPQSLRGLTIAFLALFLTITLLAGFGIYFATLSMINQLVDQRIESESHELAPIGAALGRDELKRRIQELTSRRETGDLGLLLTDAQGNRIAGNAEFTRRLEPGFSTLGRHDSIEGLSAGRVLVRDIGGGMRLAVFAETEPIDHYFAVRKRIYLAGFGAIVIVVLSGLLLFHRLVGERIGQMRQTAESISDGDLSRRVPLAGDGGEFDQQAAAFNRMLDRIGLLMGEIRNVSNDISHEMRTPLARLRNELALLEQSPEAAPVRAQLQMAAGQADELLAMFAAMLRIAEIESGSRRAGFQQLRLDELLIEMAEMAQPLAEQRGQRIGIGALPPLTLRGDRQMLAQMLLNLIENAILHAPAGTAVRLSLAQGAGHAVLTIADNGPGIPADQRELVMRRFGRLDRSGQQQPGHGLGLPLAAAIARLHHGSLSLGDAGPGLLVTVELPS